MAAQEKPSGSRPDWSELAKLAPQRMPRSQEAVGKRCATDCCQVTKGITYDKPLCYEHWKEFDDYRLLECERCRWFDEFVGTWSDDDLCSECFDRERKDLPPTPVYGHGPVERRVRYLYILKLDRGKYYVGQTNSLELRFREHVDGSTPSTRGKHPKLVYFQEWVGERDELNEGEDFLTQLANRNPRAIRRMVEEWQKPLRLVDLGG